MFSGGGGAAHPALMAALLLVPAQLCDAARPPPRSQSPVRHWTRWNSMVCCSLFGAFGLLCYHVSMQPRCGALHDCDFSCCRSHHLKATAQRLYDTEPGVTHSRRSGTRPVLRPRGLCRHSSRTAAIQQIRPWRL